MSASTITWTDGDGTAVLSNGKPEPGDRFGLWKPDAEPIGPYSIRLGTGQLDRFKFRRDNRVSFELAAIPSDQLPLLRRLRFHLMSGGTVQLDGDRELIEDFAIASLAPDTTPEYEMSDRQTLEYTFTATLISASTEVDTGGGDGGGGGGGGGGGNVGTCYLTCGTGSPEGVVTAPIGTPYEQTDAASSDHSLWIKFSNAGNTGWRRWNGLAGAAGSSGTGYRIGDGSVATGDYSLAIGEDESSSDDNSLSIGHGNSASTNNSEAIANTGRVIIGYDNTLTHTATDIGWNYASFNKCVVIGNSNSIDSGDGIASDFAAYVVVGEENTIDNAYTVGVFGQRNSVTDSAEIDLFGQDNTITNSDCCTVVGHDNTMDDGGSSVLVGMHSGSGSGATVAIGGGVGVGMTGGDANGGVAVGCASVVELGRGIAIGYQAWAPYEESIALGAGAKASGANKMRIGSTTAPIDTIEVMTSSGLKTVTLT